MALDQPFDVDGLYSLRAALVAHGSHLGASEAELERLVIVAGELATNAIRHGGGSGRLRLWRAGDALVCEVSDGGPGITDPAVGLERPEPTAVGGRGLWISRQFSDTVTITPASPGTVVTVAITLAPTSP